MALVCDVNMCSVGEVDVCSVGGVNECSVDEVQWVAMCVQWGH